MSNVETGLPYGERKRREELAVQGPAPRASIAEPDPSGPRPITEGMAMGSGGGPEMLPNIQNMVSGAPVGDFSQLVQYVSALEYVIDGSEFVDPTMLMLVRQLRSQVPAEVTAGTEPV